MPWPWAGMSPLTVTIAPAAGSPSTVSMCSTHSWSSLIAGSAGRLSHDARKRPFSLITPAWRFGTGVTVGLGSETDGSAVGVATGVGDGVADGSPAVARAPGMKDDHEQNGNERSHWTGTSSSVRRKASSCASCASVRSSGSSSEWPMAASGASR